MPGPVVNQGMGMVYQGSEGVCWNRAACQSCEHSMLKLLQAGAVTLLHWLDASKGHVQAESCILALGMHSTRTVRVSACHFPTPCQHWCLKMPAPSLTPCTQCSDSTQLHV
jgi:hypothetical protein